MNAPGLHRFNVDEYYRMAETGVLRSEARVELLDGVIHDMSPIGLRHAGVVIRLNQFFGAIARGRWLVSPQNPARVDSYSELQPDLQLLKPAPDDYMNHRPTPDDVLLLIEVADTSLAKDRKRKLPLYARSGISEAWIVNLPDRVIEVYREPHPKSYRSKTVCRPGNKVSPAAFPKVVVDVAKL